MLGTCKTVSHGGATHGSSFRRGKVNASSASYATESALDGS